jgi:hypothetical protein
VATWQLAARQHEEVHELEAFGATVVISPSGFAVCVGLKNRADLKSVYDLIQ